MEVLQNSCVSYRQKIINSIFFYCFATILGVPRSFSNITALIDGSHMLREEALQCGGVSESENSRRSKTKRRASTPTPCPLTIFCPVSPQNCVWTQQGSSSHTAPTSSWKKSLRSLGAAWSRHPLTNSQMKAAEAFWSRWASIQQVDSQILYRKVTWPFLLCCHRRKGQPRNGFKEKLWACSSPGSCPKHSASSSKACS